MAYDCQVARGEGNYGKFSFKWVGAGEGWMDDVIRWHNNGRISNYRDVKRGKLTADLAVCLFRWHQLGCHFSNESGHK